jgi:ferrous iron transport protein B
VLRPRVRLLMAPSPPPPRPHPAPAPAREVALVGAESSGKSTLTAALAGRRPRAENVAGSTVTVERVTTPDGTVLLDTPGILHGSDSQTTRTTLGLLSGRDTVSDPDVLLVVRATHLDDELRELLPLVAARRGAVAVTGWDRVEDTEAARTAVATIGAQLGVPIVRVDARHPDATAPVLDALGHVGIFTRGPLLVRAGWRVEPPATVLEHRWFGPPLALGLLLAPAVAAVWAAITIAGRVDPWVTTLTDRLVDTTTSWPEVASAVVVGDYGLATMVPLLVVWALPTVLALAGLLGVLKASGLLDRCTTAVHPLVRPFGLTGRDLVRVVAGHGCNVPAVIATRSCSSCSQDPTIGAIAFGSACSYQLAATLGVLTAAARPALVVPYLGMLIAGGLLHARLLTPRRDRGPNGRLDLDLLRGRAFLVAPRWCDVRREAAVTLEHATLRALPIFLGISALASLAAVTGVLDRLAQVLGPLLAPLGLPAEVALPVVMASVRKDGVLLLGETSVLAGLDSAQLLASLLLAGTLLPCLVTALTIARERGQRVAGRLLVRQAGAAILLTGAVSWIGRGVLT